MFRDHVGEPRSNLTESLEQLERDASDFKLVRGFASLLEREATFETVTPVPPERVRRVTFEAGAAIGVARDPDRDRALAQAADRLGTTAAEIESALYADRDQNQIMTAFESRWDADTLLTQYNLSLAQTALFDATEIELSSTDPRAIVSAVKRLGLMYEIRATDSGRVIEVTGPDSLFRRTRRYGTAFARVLRTVAATAECIWRHRSTMEAPRAHSDWIRRTSPYPELTQLQTRVTTAELSPTSRPDSSGWISTGHSPGSPSHYGQVTG